MFVASVSTRVPHLPYRYGAAFELLNDQWAAHCRGMRAAEKRVLGDKEVWRVVSVRWGVC